MTVDCPARYATPRTPSRRTLGGVAAKVAKLLGQPLMPWQQQVADVALELDDNGNLCYRELVLTTGRQAGKTLLVYAILVVLSLRRPRQRSLYTAQSRQDAKKKLVEDWLPLAEPTPVSLLYTKRLANGSEGLRFHNGSLIGLLATTKKSGHGGSIDCAVVDEAFSQVDSRLEIALKPAMITRPDPLLIVTSAAGTPTDSPYLLDKVVRGREIAEAGVNSGVAFFEWGAPEDADPSDPATWRMAMPALGRTITEEAVRADFLGMELSDFRRTYMNIWVANMSDPVIPLATWDALTDVNSTISSGLALGIDVSPDRSTASIAAAGKRPDNRWHVETIQQGPGTLWIAARVAELVRAHAPAAVVVDGASPAASLVPELERLGVTVTVSGPKDAATGCGLFYDAATSGGLRHLGTTELRTALDGAARRPLGDAWGWSRRKSNVGITPLVAATGAMFGSETNPKGGLVWSLSEVARDMLAREDAERSATALATKVTTLDGGPTASISLSDWWDKYGHNLGEEEADDDEGD